jgi:hypothetical protein
MIADRSEYFGGTDYEKGNPHPATKQALAAALGVAVGQFEAASC